MSGERACNGGVSLLSIAHPVPWGSHLDPDAIASGSVDVIVAGAVTIGAVGDAVVACDYAEQARRRRVGLGPVTSLCLLDSVMTLPAGAPIRVADLSEEVWACVSAAPEGVVVIDGGWVTRLLSPPLTVVGAVVCGKGWRHPLQRVGRFTPFAQRLLVLEKMPPSQMMWEAQVAGVGVWTFKDSQLTEICPPDPFRRRYWKPGRPGVSPNVPMLPRSGPAACPRGLPHVGIIQLA